VTKGTKEPYRMFTSRAEYRLLLREDNAEHRLGEYGFALSLISKERIDRIREERQKIGCGLLYLKEHCLTPSKDNLALLESLGQEKIADKTPLIQVIGRKGFEPDHLRAIAPLFEAFEPSVLEQIVIEAKYASYIQRQQGQIEKMEEMLKVIIPEDFVFEGISGLSLEVVEKLKRYAPKTLFAASQISGITPASLEVLHLYIYLRSKQ